MKKNLLGKALLAFAIMVSFLPFGPAFAVSVSDGFDSTSDPLHISANTTLVITVTGATKSTQFEGPVKVLGASTLNSGLTVTGLATLNSGLNVTGSTVFNGTITAQNYFYPSDLRLKDNIHTVKGLDIVEHLKGVSFTWKNNLQPCAGILAQDVEKVMPDAVHTRDDGLKVVEYSQLMAPMIEAIKELKAENDKLALRVNALEAQKDLSHKASYRQVQNANP